MSVAHDYTAEAAAAAANDATVQIEQSLIGICMMEPAALLAAGPLLESRHFVEKLHGDLWTAMNALASGGRPVSPLTMIGKLGNPEIVPDMRLSQYLAACCAQTSCPAAYAGDFALQVREAWALRTTAAIADAAAHAARTPGGDARAIISRAVQELDETRAEREVQRKRGQTLGEVMAATVDRVAHVYQHDGRDDAISTGLADLDRILSGGFRPSELVVLAGRPGMGKTTLAASVLRQSAKRHAGVMFSLEMSAVQLGYRFLADVLFDGAGTRSLRANQLMRAEIQPAEFDQVVDAARSMADLPLIIDDTSSLTVGEIAARSRGYADRMRRSGRTLETVIIDYLKCIRPSERYRGNRNLELGEITGALKQMAKDLNVAVVLLHQLNRSVEMSADKRPTMAHLRDSGEIEQDADIVLLLYREQYYLAQSEPRMGTEEHLAWQAEMENACNKMEIIVAKQRMGAQGTITTMFDGGAGAVRDLAAGDRIPDR